MSLSPSYPGIYIQELPLDTHTITPAPTSIAAFVGYTHPWKTPIFGQAIQCFSFTDFQNNFGGLYTSGYISSDVARAVYQFFQNGGTNAFVVGLQPEALSSTDSSLGVFGNGSPDLFFSASMKVNGPAGFALAALEPCDIIPMTATVSNMRASTSTSGFDTFDLVLTYGTRVEVYRGINFTIAPGQPKSLDKLINGVSSLVTVSPLTAGTYGAAFPPATPLPIPLPAPVTNFSITLPAGFSGTYSASDFVTQFQENSALDNLEIFNLLLIPGISDNTVVSAALAFAERKRAFAILDPPQQYAAVATPTVPSIDSYAQSMPTSQNGALYFPYLKSTDLLTGSPITMPPSGYVAGVYASTDSSRGVWKAPAGIATALLGTTGPVPSGLMNDQQQGVLNLDAVNCLRAFNSVGTVVYGARTLVGAQANTAFPQSVYVPVRRMTLFIEQTLVANLKWVVFEPNDWPLWLAIRMEIESFLLALFNQGALQGSTPSAAFQVKCDSTTTTPANQQAGIVNIVVAVALLKPAEFVIIKISQIAGQTS
jgi:phage tail sheath protein FI